MKEERSFFDHLSIIKEQPSRDAIHDLRVCVKKIKAYLLLNEDISGLEFKQTFKKLKACFDIAGKYRDTQMAIALAKKQTGKHNEFLRLFIQHSQQLLPMTEQCAKQGATDLDIAVIGRLRLFLDEGVGEKDNAELRGLLKTASENKLQEAKKLSDSFKENAHLIRKILKTVYYWLLIIPPPSLISAGDMKILEELLDLLGKWQDHIVLIKKLRKFRKEWLVKETMLCNNAKEFEISLEKQASMLLKKAEMETLLIWAHVYP